MAVKENLVIEWFQEKVLLIGHQDDVIWHRWPLFFGVTLKIRSKRNNPQFVKDKIIRVNRTTVMSKCEVTIRAITHISIINKKLLKSKQFVCFINDLKNAKF